MKISINWVKEFVDLPPELSAKQMAHDLTMATVEVEDVVDYGAQLNKVVAGKVKEVKKHPNADRLTLVSTDLGQYGIKEIVCGGSNLKEGMFVAVAMPGAQVYWHGEDKLTTLTETAVRGVKSFGMICAASELALDNLFAEKSEKEILDLSGIAEEPGQNLSELLGYNDIIFEIDNKSLTNRPDLWGHYGIAREFAAFYKLELKALELPDISVKKASDPFLIEIQDKNLCPRYTAISISGVKNKESPFWLRSKLSRVGNNSHGFLVDLTNYILLTLGQPSHAFDRDKIEGSAIVIRTAKDKEKFKLLDGQELDLTTGNLVIADAKKAISLAGVMGGADSAVTESTNKILFESATFNAVNVRKTSSAFGVRTDSSTRYEKSLDPELCPQAGKMFVSMLKKEFPECEILSVQDEYAVKKETPELILDHSFVVSRLGSFVDQKSIVDKLTTLGFEVKIAGDKYNVKVPSWRATGDISIFEDLVEEIARVTGYDNIPPLPVTVTLSQPVFHREYMLEKSFKIFLAEQCGYYEIYSYPWVSEKSLKLFNTEVAEYASLAAPPDQSTAFLRTSLLPGLAEAAQKNLRFFDAVNLFEMGKVFNAGETLALSSKGEKLPDQSKLISGIRAGKDRQKLFISVKSNLADLFAYHNLEADFQQEGERAANYFERLSVVSGGKKLGFLGVPDKRLKKNFDLSEPEVVIFELNFDLIKSLTPKKTVFKEIPKFPGVDFDLSLLFDKSAEWMSIRRAIAKTDVLIENVVFIEEFYGKQIPEGKKAVVLRVSLRSAERTLTTEEVNAIMARVLSNLEKLGGELRKA